jgi:spore germination protein YaaH
MAYDYHATDSFVTGPVAPLTGAGTISEYDVTAATEKALELVPAQKLILGIPLYGYEWESVGQAPRSAIIPNTGVAASNRRAEELLTSCSYCITKLDSAAEESYISYLDKNTGDYHTIFYPNENSTVKKINFTKNFHLGGVALWALGYEGKNILNPLINYKKE